MQTTSGTSTATDLAVDELGDAVVALVRTWRSVGRHGPDGTQSTFAALEMAQLLSQGEHRLSEIAERRGVDQSVVSRQIGELEQRQLVSRRRDPSDRRASLVRLTPHGRDGPARRLAGGGAAGEGERPGCARRAPAPARNP